MKQKPILFSTPMVQAILEGRKTQTRRIIKGIEAVNHADLKELYDQSPDYFNETCPYGKPGDFIWVRETFAHCGNNRFLYKANGCEPIPPNRWKPSIHMPKIACRLYLKIKSVRVEQLKDINTSDARSEGLKIDPISKTKYINYVDGSTTYNERTSFYSLWEKINGKESLDSNPWVWVVEFERIEKPDEDEK